MKLINSVLSNLEKIHKLQLSFEALKNDEILSTDGKSKNSDIKTRSISTRKISDELANFMKKLQNDFKHKKIKKTDN